jgi:four helix bundle protein
MQDYKTLKIWEKAHSLALKTYELTANFPKEEHDNITNQLRRSILSIPTNIAEGTGKYSNREFAKSLQIALSSSNEAEYLILFSRDLKLLSNDDFEFLRKEIGELKTMLAPQIKKLRRTLNI